MSKSGTRITEKDLRALAKSNPALAAQIDSQLSSKKSKNQKVSDPKDILTILNSEKRKEQEINHTEKRLMRELSLEKIRGNILDFHFEKIGLQIAPKTWYFPDFMVFMPDGSLHAVEVKGFLRDDAAAKYKVAVGLFPGIQFHMIRSKSQKWKEVLRTLENPLDPSKKTDGKNCRITR